jgi:alkanesulfonate monooxygenase SsuD/methylene tetrahydromethanopterin reductase-like flavin-dependent oxidoreductase (luciferase family)
MTRLALRLSKGDRMKFSLRLNNDLPVREYIPLAQAAEAVGFDQFWVSNDLFLRSDLVILAAVAQATQRIEIGTGILNPYTIHPAEMAMLAATLDELSGNRFNLGIAAGAGEFLKWIGIEQAKPLAATRETILAIRRLLQGERVDGGSLSALPGAARYAYLCRRHGAQHVDAGRRTGGRRPALTLSAGTLFWRPALY